MANGKWQMANGKEELTADESGCLFSISLSVRIRVIRGKKLVLPFAIL
jgi:hypothetical protein